MYTAWKPRSDTDKLITSLGNAGEHSTNVLSEEDIRAMLQAMKSEELEREANQCSDLHMLGSKQCGSTADMDEESEETKQFQDRRPSRKLSQNRHF